MIKSLRIAHWRGALSQANSGARHQTMRNLVRAEMASLLGAALKLGIAMLVFEGMLWLAAVSAPAAPGAVVAVKALQTGQRVVVGLAECAPTTALRGLCVAPSAH